MTGADCRTENIRNFRGLVEKLLQLRATAPQREIQHISIQCICAFGMLNAAPGGPNTLDGEEVTRIVESAVLSMVPPAEQIASVEAELSEFDSKADEGFKTGMVAWQKGNRPI